MCGLIVRLVILAVIIVSCHGCATTYTEQEQYEINDKRAKDLEIWTLCQKVYKKQGAILWHVGHELHENRSHKPHLNRQVAEMREDIRSNDCRRIYNEVMKEKS